MRRLCAAALIGSSVLFAGPTLGFGPTTAPTSAPALSGTAVRVEAMRLLSAGKQADAEQLIFDEARDRPTLRTVFFAAVLVRSRFELEQADRMFGLVARSKPDSVEGRTARLVIAIDGGENVDDNVQALDQLTDAQPNDPLVLWMVAVECRQLHRNRAGIDRYRRLLKMLTPGPALVHQTLGNLLLDDGQPAAALAEYDIAIGMEPAAWDYNCRGNALKRLGRPDEAAAAYRKATELDPTYEYAWRNWAKLCAAQGDFQGASEKAAKADEIDRRSGPP